MSTFNYPHFIDQNHNYALESFLLYYLILFFSVLFNPSVSYRGVIIVSHVIGNSVSHLVTVTYIAHSSMFLCDSLGGTPSSLLVIKSVVQRKHEAGNL